MTAKNKIAGAVGEVYGWVDAQLAQVADRCGGCGKCCDFETFGHRLFVTSPEMIYFAESVGAERVKAMANGRCPYNVDGRCGVYEHRFTGCRIFSCKDDGELQGVLTEKVLEKLKSICKQFDIAYRYTGLRSALDACVKSV